VPETVVLNLLVLFALVGAATVLFARRATLYAFGFLAVSLAIAGLYALLHHTFLFVAQLLVAVGAVVVLTVLVVATLNLDPARQPEKERALLPLAAATVVVTPIGWMLYRALHGWLGTFPTPPEGFGSVQAMGGALFSSWVLPFEILSLVLLAAMVGAIVLAKRDETDERKEMKR